MPSCPDLRDHASRFRVWNETEGRRAHERDDPWDLILPGQAGFIAPWGNETLVACTNSTVTTRRILDAVPGAKVVQDGSDGQNITFAPEGFEAVAGILRLRRRRQSSAAAHLAAFRFNPRLQGDEIERQGVPAASGDFRPTSTPGTHSGAFGMH
jgi:hypothetical protein